MRMVILGIGRELVVKRNEELSYIPSLNVLFNISLSDDANGFNDINPATLSAFFAWEIEQTLKNNLRFSIEPFFKYTPNEFTIFANLVEARTNFEFGMNLRLKL